LLKPGFFANEDLTEVHPPDRATTVSAATFAARLCYEGLWLLADRQGRLEDRPKRIKAQIFPYEDVDVDLLLDALAAAGFLTRYTVNGGSYIALPTFLKHQSPHHREPDSTIPAPNREASAQPGLSLSDHQARPQTGPSVIDPVLDPVPESESDPETESESGSGVGVGNGTKSSAAKSAARPTHGNPNDNVSVITRIAHEAIGLLGQTDTNLAEAVKDLCAQRRIAYDSGVVRKAIESALVQRARVG
jgi:hypothetical protein